MREHLYRGFYETNNGDKVITLNGKQYRGEWVEGNLFVGDDGECEILIGTKVVRISYPVIPETVCEYTSLTDKNGKKIFEDDISIYHSQLTGNSIGVVKYLGNRYELEPIKNNNFCLLKTYCLLHSAYISGDAEVISNIFETPELLKKN